MYHQCDILLVQLEDTKYARDLPDANAFQCGRKVLLSLLRSITGAAKSLVQFTNKLRVSPIAIFS